ncbi:MAG: tRNA preQ1(34) S-adenosylmethionine ribosyltransferase-isomerase QueA [Acidimicrobiaceae bacterium]|nr:tRNA preQ1(34) S-adenosylmethionine ribosyltransferase-isomerase QueA [Acidimicrobiaceae bacterium]
MGPDDFAYDLPDDQIAQVPLDDRSSARLLVDLADGTGPDHRHISDLPDMVGPGDLLVLNDTRVLPARLRLTKETGGAVEVLLLEQTGDDREWEALVRPGRRVPPGTRLRAGDDLTVTVGDDLGEGRRTVMLDTNPPAGQAGVLVAVQAHGEMPLPPYLHTRLDDPERYQTVYSNRPASAAAPTAGLHLTGEVLDACRASGAAVEHLELVVGLDTFRPVTAGDLDDHVMHSESYTVAESTLDACRTADRVIAVGTTTVRALESANLADSTRDGTQGRTDLFIRPGFDFGVVDVLLTNYHLPRSTLLVMLEAFVGPRWRDLYALALAHGYRFLSFGDAMLVGRRRSDRITP